MRREDLKQPKVLAIAFFLVGALFASFVAYMGFIQPADDEVRNLKSTITYERRVHQDQKDVARMWEAKSFEWKRKAQELAHELWLMQNAKKAPEDDNP